MSVPFSFYRRTTESNSMNSPIQQAKHSALVKPREGPCLNVMDAEAHARQAQHRNRYARISIAPMHGEGWDGYMVPKPFTEVNTHAY